MELKRRVLWPLPRRLWWVLVGGFCVVLLTIGRPAWHLLRTSLSDRNELEPLPAGTSDDASRLNRTRVAEVWPVPADPAEAEKQLVDLVARAHREGLKISIAGARHSMGGHTIYPNGIVINMLPFRALSLDEENDLLHAGAGARWEEIIPYLDARGKSVAVMQSNDSFSVGGSISVNCHGWQHNHAPIASTVESFRLLQADGAIVHCSREENRELFSLVLGGYGLFGVILDVSLHVVPNRRYSVHRYLIAADEYAAIYEREVNWAPGAGMVYGRLSVTSGNFLEEAILTVFREALSADGPLPELSDIEYTRVRRAIFRGSVGSDYGKDLRWNSEKTLQNMLEHRFFSRNQLLNESADVYGNRSAATTDILHEYFIPTTRFNDFVHRARTIIPRYEPDLLNVTIRNVYRDDDTFLRYADQEMLALVMLFNQPRTPAGDAQMEQVTRELIDAALECGGRYYLPYRLHATAAQFARAYPQGAAFFALKREYDPEELFQNEFYRRYGTVIGPGSD
jgi:FAD/FMN-containing dehydrogenase